MLLDKENVFNTIIKKAEEYNDKCALMINSKSGKTRKLSYRDILQSSLEFGQKLSSIGVEKGDRVVLVAANSPEWVIAFLAIIRLGAVAVFIDPVLPSNEIGRLISISQSKGVLSSVDVGEKLEHLDNLNLPVLNIFDDANHFKWSKHDKSDIDKEIEPCENDVLAIIFSSGTTSTAKGVMIRHKSISTMVNKAIELYKFNAQDRYLKVIPIYHIYGFSILMCCLFSGGTMCFIESLSSQVLSKAFIDFKPSIFFCVPKVYEMFRQKILWTVEGKGSKAKKIFSILNKFSGFARNHGKINIGKVLFKSVHKVFGGHIRLFGSGGMMLEKETALFFNSLGFNILSAYGITETAIPVTANTFENNVHGTNGKPYPGVQVEIVNKNEQGLGEIYIKTPGMMKGYFNDIESTKNAFTEDGWFKSGDVGTFDEKGNLIITGRIKEAILLSNGKKASPTDIETLYSGLEGVSEFVVCGVPLRSSNYDEIHAFIVKNDEVTKKDNEIEGLIKNVASKLPHHFRIAKIHFVKEIPKTSIQKPKRYILRQMVMEV